MSDDGTAGSSGNGGPIRLRGAQRRLRDAYFEHDAGLFTKQCVPGSGKSVLTHHLAAEELLRRYVDGDPTPEQHVCVVSFNRDEAAGIVPGIVARLEELVAHDLTPAGAAASMADVRYLETRVRDASFIGTIDSVLTNLFEEVPLAAGFETAPRVGSAADLAGVHAACYEDLTENPALAAAIEGLETAYPAGEYEDGPAELLRQACQHCRAHRMTTAAFVAELRATVEAVYAEGASDSIGDIADAVSRCLDREDIDPDHVRAGRDDQACRALLEADREVQTAWQEAIDAFGELLAAYREAYETQIRERGVVSHTDCAFLLAEALTAGSDLDAGSDAGSDTDTDADADSDAGTNSDANTDPDPDSDADAGTDPTTDIDAGSDTHTNSDTDGAVGEIRERVLARYRSRIESVIIDEAQDLSTLQHAALAPVITEDCRVHAAGDVRQTIYEWRDARPALFQRAVEAGQYFGVDWDTHVTETTRTTYRCRPAIATAIDAIAGPALTDPDRGNLGDLDVSYPELDPAREASDDPSVHVAAFETTAPPGTPEYVAPDTGTGEAGILATYLACGLADGTLQPREPGREETAADTETGPEIDTETGTETGTEETERESESETETGTETDTEPAAEPGPDGAGAPGGPAGVDVTANGGHTDGVANGTDDASRGTDRPEVVVLFRWRTHMPEFARAFEAEGLAVANASEYLFACPAVRAVLAVTEWLVAPADPDRLQTLVTDGALGLGDLAEVFHAYDWDLDAVLGAIEGDHPDDVDLDVDVEITDRHRAVLARLQELRADRPRFRAQSVARTVADVIEGLALRADPAEIAPTVAPAQRSANLDALVEFVADGDWGSDHGRDQDRDRDRDRNRNLEADTTSDLAALVDGLAPVCEQPHQGPTQPATPTDDHDVLFTTIHRMKGGEADVVALADLGWPLRKHGPPSQRLLATGSVVGLAPPAAAGAPEVGPLPGFARGVYDPAGGDEEGSGPGSGGTTPFPRDVGLRWASERWVDEMAGQAVGQPGSGSTASDGDGGDGGGEEHDPESESKSDGDAGGDPDSDEGDDSDDDDGNGDSDAGSDVHDDNTADVTTDATIDGGVDPGVDPQLAGRDATATGLVGHDRVQAAVRTRRAEAWRLLYVALSRARDHLVVPLPREVPGAERPRDRWVDTIRAGLQFDEAPRAGTYTVTGPAIDGPTARSLTVAVNDVDMFADRSRSDTAATPHAATTPPDRSDLPALVPRFVRPSTLYPLTEAPDEHLLDHLQNRPLHTDAETVDDDLPLTPQTLDTEAVGTVAHAVLTTAVEEDVPATALRTGSEEVEAIIDAAVQRLDRPVTISDAEREGLVAFLTEHVLPDFVASETWGQLQAAETVYVEKPLRARLPIPDSDSDSDSDSGVDGTGDVAVEVDGQADFVYRMGDDSWHVTDLKVALTDVTPETRRRYQLQVAAYAACLATEDGVSEPITRAVQTVGAHSRRIVSEWPRSVVARRLRGLLEDPLEPES